MTIELTDKRGMAGGRVVHAAQGGGKGLRGRYVKGVTWCGVERRRPGLLLVETDAAPTCMACQRHLAVHRKLVKQTLIKA